VGRGGGEEVNVVLEEEWEERRIRLFYGHASQSKASFDGGMIR